MEISNFARAINIDVKLKQRGVGCNKENINDWQYEEGK